ncbi:MAG: hypothetical protein ACM3JJ_11500 [Hyphomicrobiales bacterium]
MLSLRLVRLLDSHAEQLADTLFTTLLESPECADLRKVPRDHLELRSREIYRNLSDWLTSGTEWEIAERYIALGQERAAQGVALSHFIWAIGATKKTLFDFLDREGLADNPIELHASMELLKLLDRFYDTAVYYASVGYERQFMRSRSFIDAA